MMFQLLVWVLMTWVMCWRKFWPLAPSGMILASGWKSPSTSLMASEVSSVTARAACVKCWRNGWKELQGPDQPGELWWRLSEVKQWESLSWQISWRLSIASQRENLKAGVSSSRPYAVYMATTIATFIFLFYYRELLHCNTELTY